jgi:hypothetical protein
MTAIDEREQTAAAPVAPETCEAIWAFLGIEAPCDQPAIGQFRRICVHEHARDGWLCRDHAEIPERGLCFTCHELPDGLAHECPVAIAAVTA